MTEYFVYNHEEGYSESFYTLKEAKKAMREHNAKGEKIRIYSNGDWVNCGEILLRGSNKSFVANSPRNMKKTNY